MGAAVETRVESGPVSRPGGEPPLEVRMLGPLEVRRGGVAPTLPSSRKVRALFAYLALAPRGASRSQLCELLWDVPNDPRGELRWCLSKLRRLVDEPDRPRVVAKDDVVRLDLSECRVDAIEVERAADEGIASLPSDRARELSGLFQGELLEGLEIDRSPAFGAWLTGQRRRFRNAHAALLEHLAARVAGDEALVVLEKWLQLAPFDRRAHEMLLSALAQRGRVREAEKHLDASARLFEAEGLDFAPVRHAWRAARARQDGAVLLATVDTPPAAPIASALDASLVPPRRASVAVMPFADALVVPGAPGGVGDALAHDVITRLAKLRSLFVIAQGTVFALKERSVAAEEAGRMLDVDYVVGGSVRRQGERLAVTAELTETRSAKVVWAEIFNERLDDALLVLDAIGNRIVASIASEIETNERNRAILKPPNSLDAWEALHRGLWHMYRFTRADNEQARHFFETALRLDPTFSRAYAGLSFAHWQNAFQGWADRERETGLAVEAAGRSLAADDRDPAAHWAQGRALWLRDRHDESVAALARAVELSPNFAQGHYALAFVQAQSGDPLAAVTASDHSRSLSPFDPLLFAMLGARAMALVRLGRLEEAADSAKKAAARPNAHPHIYAIAAYSLALAGSLDEARVHAAAVRKALPGYTVADFLRAFRFDADGDALFREGAKRVGMG
jgi:DNA-binding SARP family transcriptional activator